MPMLTKSKYLTGLQCLRYLWVREHEKEKIPEPDIATQARFDEGNQVGNLAKTLFPGGIEVAGYPVEKNVEETGKLLGEGKPLFEPGFKHGNCYSRADILVPNRQGWDIVEVKSGARVKDINLQDVSFQKYCLEGAGLKIKNCFLMHVNNEYVRKGELECEKLFAKQDITDEVGKLASEIPGNVEKMLAVLEADEYTPVKIGKQCKDPYACPIAECWDFLPDNHIFHLYRGGKKCYDLFEEGIHTISQIPEEYKLNDKQGIQKKCEQTGETHVDKQGIKEFLEQLEYPIHYLDFETFATAVPMFDKTRPYEKIPFQFSLNVEQENGEVEHKSFLYEGSGDPRADFTNALKKALEKKGTIIAFNESFEKGVIKSLGWDEKVYKRFVDLIKPFRAFHYYNPEQKGSASLKNVLPAVTGKNYDRLGISDGTTASAEFVSVTYKKASDEKKEQVRGDLEKYCGLDTEGMLWIVEKLRGIV